MQTIAKDYIGNVYAEIGPIAITAGVAHYTKTRGATITDVTDRCYIGYYNWPMVAQVFRTPKSSESYARIMVFFCGGGSYHD